MSASEPHRKTEHGRQAGFLRGGPFLALLFIVGLVSARGAGPVTPTGLAAANLTATSFTLRWTAAAGGNTAGTVYEIYRDDQFVEQTSARSLLLDGLDPQTSYRLSVLGRDASGRRSAQSAVLTVITKSDTTSPTKPVGLAASEVTAHSLSLAWNPATDDVGVTGYKIFRGGNEVGSSSSADFHFTDLAADSTYRLAVRAMDRAGNVSAASPVLPVKTLADPPSSPTGLSAVNIRTVSFGLKWNTATGGTGRIAGYDVYGDGTLLGSTSKRSFVLTALQPATRYQVSVAARDGAGNVSPRSDLLVVTTLADTSRPSAPGALKAVDISAGAFALNWVASRDNVGVERYTIYASGVLVGSTPATAFSVTGLSPGSTHKMTVKAVDAAGNVSTASPVLVVRTLPADTTPPSVPTELVASEIRTDALTLGWTPSTDNVAVTGYEVYAGGTLVGRSTIPVLAVSGLLPATAYGMTVIALDGAGNRSPASRSLQVVTKEPPNAPPAVKLSAPAEGAAFAAGVAVRLEAIASDPDGSVVGVEFYDGIDKIGEDSVVPFELNWTGAGVGRHQLRAVATDNKGASASSVAVGVDIQAGAGLPFVANFEPEDGYHTGALDGQDGWSVTGPAKLVLSPVYAGRQAVAILPAAPPSILVHTFAPSAPGVTFVDLFASPAAGATPGAGVFLETDALQIALTGEAGLGRVQAFNGNGTGGGTWYATSAGPALDSSGQTRDWLRVTARTDYPARIWDLYVDGRMIAANLGFLQGAQTALTGLSLSGHPTVTTGLDDLLAGFENPLFGDVDKDGMEDAWEMAHGLNPLVNDRDGDADGDGLTNIEEYVAGTNPAKADTDGDGLSDAWELSHGLDPAQADTDRDGMPDGWELAHGFDPKSPEDAAGDFDHDGRTNLQEYQQGTDPALANDPPAGAPTALPGTLSGLRLWLRADQGIEADVENRVAAWVDQGSQHCDAFQLDAAFRPWVVAGAANGLPVVRFDGDDDWLEVPKFMGDATEGELFVVLRSPGFATRDQGWWNLGGEYGAGSALGEAGPDLREDFGREHTTSLGVPVNSPADYVIYNVAARADDWTIRLNGMVQFHSAENSVRFGENGWLGRGAEKYLQGDIAEVVAYDRALGPDEREAMGAYLAAKYSPAAITIPGQPQLTVSTAVYAEASLAWGANPAGLHTVTSVERRDEGGAAFQVIAQVVDGNNYRDAGLVPGHTYRYRINTRSLAGNSVYSAEQDLSVPLGKDAWFNDPEGDLDGDGAGNLLEAMAGTDPANPASLPGAGAAAGPDPAGVFAPATASSMAPELRAVSYVGITLHPPDGNAGALLPVKVAGNGRVLLAFNNAYGGQPRGYHWYQGAFYPLRHSPAWAQAASPSSPQYSAWTSLSDINSAGFSVGSVSYYAEGSRGLEYPTVPVYWGPTGGEPIKLPAYLDPMRRVTDLPAQAIDHPGTVFASIPYYVDAQGQVFSSWAPLLDWVYTADRVNTALEAKPGTASHALAIADTAIIAGSYTESDVARSQRTDAHEYFAPAAGISPALVWNVINNQWHTPAAWNYSVETKLFDSRRSYNFNASGQQHFGSLRWPQPGIIPQKIAGDLTFIGQSASGDYLLTYRAGYGYEINSPSSALAHVPDGPINNSGRFLSGASCVDTLMAPPGQTGVAASGAITETDLPLPGLAGGRAIALNNYGHVLGRKADGAAALWLWRDGAYSEWPVELNLPAGALVQDFAPWLTDRGLFLAQLTAPGRESIPALFVPAGLQADANHDGSIDAEDKTAGSAPFAFLLNASHDQSAPGAAAEAENLAVDGVRDLVNFFPVVLDIQALVAVLPPGPDIKYKLKHADGALNFVGTTLNRASAFAFRAGSSTTGFGPDLLQPVAKASVQQITSVGVELSGAFLAHIMRQAEGVILVEGRVATTQPLVLSVEQEGVSVAELSLPLQTLRATIAVDANGDGRLRLSSEDDSDTVTSARAWPFWLNQNDDAPGESFEPDFANDRVDGPEDLADFAPLFLDIKELMAVLPADPAVKYILRQEESALNFVYTDLTPATAFSFRDGASATGFGPEFDQSAATAPTQRITAQGVELSAQFLDRIRNRGQGVILVEGRGAMVHPLTLSVEMNGIVLAAVTLGLAPQLAELGVDANRDGRIRLPSEDASDLTGVDAPFRFWLNEGVDGPGAEGEETMEPGSFGSVHDYQADHLSSKRDLEDWAPVRLSIPAALATPRMLLPLTDPASGLTARLEWRHATPSPSIEGLPSLKFVAAVRPGKDYLKDAQVAAQQIAGSQGAIIGRVDRDSACAIPAALWQIQPDGRLEANLLLEGAAPGQGQLVLGLYRHGQRLSGSGNLPMQIRRMQDLYEHWTANADDTDARGAAISPVPLHPLGSNPAPFEFSASEPGLSLPSDAEGNDYILFVHGWRMKPWERRAFAETAAKRLYQLGYRGKFGFFSWPTEWVNLDVWYAAVVNALADPDHYDRCEVVARAAGHGPLARLLLDLRGRYGASRVHVFAHSMGNVVVSEALRALPENDPVAAHYVACQSAEVASAYENLVRDTDGSVNLNPPSASPALGGPDRYTYGAAFARDAAETGLTEGANYHQGLTSRVGIMANFYNGGDSALSKWDINQHLKPDHTAWLRDTAYGYELAEDPSTSPARVRDRYLEDPSGLSGANQRHELHWDIVPERHRILAFIVQARSRATGATKGINGEFRGKEVDLSTKAYSFSTMHSAEFLGDSIGARSFYRQLLSTFQKTFDEAP